MPVDHNLDGTPIHNLQYMLKIIGLRDPMIPPIHVTGVFDEETLEAVMIFQREYGFPVTGEVDQLTWSAIFDVYGQARYYNAKPRTANLYPNDFDRVHPEDTSGYLYPIQGMFCTLSHVFDNIDQDDVNGVHDGTSVQNTKILQQCCGREDDGVFDCTMWDILTGLYDTFVIRNPNYNGQMD